MHDGIEHLHHEIPRHVGDWNIPAASRDRDGVLTVTSIPQYVNFMQTRQQIIATKMGSDPARTDKQIRVFNLALLILIACIVKTLVDKGVISDADILATLNTARDAAYADEPIVPPGADPGP